MGLHGSDYDLVALGLVYLCGLQLFCLLGHQVVASNLARRPDASKREVHPGSVAAAWVSMLVFLLLAVGHYGGGSETLFCTLLALAALFLVVGPLQLGHAFSSKSIPLITCTLSQLASFALVGLYVFFSFESV